MDPISLSSASAGLSTAAAALDDDFDVDDPDALRARIRDANDIGIELVPMPKWGDGVVVEVRSMTGHEKAKYLASTNQKDGRIDWKGIAPSLLIACCWAPARRRSTGETVPGKSTKKLFRPGDEDLILRKSGDQLERIAQVALRLSGLVAPSDDTSASDDEN